MRCEKQILQENHHFSFMDTGTFSFSFLTADNLDMILKVFFLSALGGTLFQCMAAPVHPVDKHSVDHLQSAGTSSHGNPSHTTTFEHDLDVFLHAWNTHPNPSDLLPSPSHSGGVSPSSRLHPPIQSPHSQQSYTGLQDTNSLDLHSSRHSSPDHSQTSLAAVSRQDWKNGLNGQLMKVYKAYMDRVGCSRSVAFDRLRARGTPEIAQTLLSNNPAQQDAAIAILGRPKDTKTGIRHQLLGDKAESITKQFAEYHHLNIEQARHLLNLRLKEEQAALLLDPNRFKEGAEMLPPQTRKPLTRHGWTPMLRSLFEQYKTHYHEMERVSQPSREDHQSGKKRKAVDSSIDHGEGKKQKLMTMEHLGYHKYAEAIIPAKVIGQMTAAYKDYVACHLTTAHYYVRKEISEHPEKAYELAEDLLSEDAVRISAAIYKIGAPGIKKEKKRVVGAVLPDNLKRKVVYDVRRLRRTSRIRSEEIVDKRLNDEIARELQESQHYDAALQKLLLNTRYRTPYTGKADPQQH